ncbi:DUF6788 family protein [Haloarcula japonica]|uniref:DUF6788 family protein n=1 Tax=Haloarcula japonica TaxID=29282 RepID=UPI0039F6EDDE
MATPPSAPDSLPKYIREGVPNQDDDALRDLQAWVDDLLEYRHDLDEKDIEAGEGEEIEEVNTTPTKTEVIKKVSCGKSNCRCSRGKSEWHGPYRYETWREDGEIKWEYIGPVNG